MTGKKGRKCSIKDCNSFQHTHKHLSFFRFPKDLDRCKLWIERSGRPDLAEKLSVHEDRVCEIHFEKTMFLNDYRNRLHQTAVPILYLDGTAPLPPASATSKSSASRPVPKLKPMNSNSLYLTKEDFMPQTQFKRQKIDHSDELLEEMEPPRQRRRYAHSDPQLLNSNQYRDTGIKIDLSQTNATLSPHIQSQIRSQLKHQEQLMNGPPKMTPIQIKPLANNGNNTKSIQFMATKNQPALSLIKQHSGKLSTTQQAQHHQSSGQSKMTNISTSSSTSSSTATLSGSYKRPRQIFSIEQEEQLADFVRETSNYYNGMSSKDIRTLAFVYGVCNQVDLPIGWRETYLASFDWCLGFIKRNKLTSMMITSHCRNSSSNNYPTTISDVVPVVNNVNVDTKSTTERLASEAC